MLIWSGGDGLIGDLAKSNESKSSGYETWIDSMFSWFKSSFYFYTTSLISLDYGT